MRKIIIALLLTVSSQLTAWAARETVVIEVPAGANASAIAAQLGGKVIDEIPGTSHYLISVPSAAAVAGHPSITAEKNVPVALRPAGRQAIFGVPDVRGTAWYAQQPAMKLVGADKALAFSKGRGVVVADLNSRVDYRHPALAGHLTGGYDFILERASRTAGLDQSSASFLDQSSAAFLDQSSAAFLDQSSAAFLDQSSAAFLDQSTAAFLDQSTANFLDQSSASFLDDTNPAHGHGTFCAGLIAAVAPEAMIMPLRVFDDKGMSDGFMIARAIYYAVQHGAGVINMSFGMSSEEKVVKKAVAFALQRGVIVVASAGNNNTSVPQYPAAFNGVIGVAATDLKDKKADFSNFGKAVSVDAPGINIISAYPGGFYALGSGTSFSAPFVAGEAALLKSESWKASEKPIVKGVVNIDLQNPEYVRQLGSGRIDMLRAMQSVD